METQQLAPIDILAQEVFEEFRRHVLEGGNVSPILFLHDYRGDEEPELLDMMLLENEDQSTWPDVIRAAVDRTDATLWALATLVTVRWTSADRTRHRDERLFAYLVADAARPEAARIWAANLGAGATLSGPLADHSNDPELQLMLAHLTGRQRIN